MRTTPENEAQQRRAIAMAVALTADTGLVPRRYERHLLNGYEQGKYTIEQVLELLAASVYRVVYRSRAVRLMTEPEIRELLEQSRIQNAVRTITGILLYSDGYFVQVLEGEEKVVRDLYARIQSDPRHTQVVTVSEGLGPARRFADWDMGFGRVPTQDAEQLLESLAESERNIEPILNDARLQALLQVFGVC